MVEANTNAKLLIIATQQLNLKDSTIFALSKVVEAKDSVITSKESIVSLKEEIIEGKDHEIGDLRLELTAINRKLKWTKLKASGITIGLTGVLLYTIINN